MSFGGYWEVYDSTPVSEVKDFLSFNDNDVTLFREFLSNKFNSSLRKPLTSTEDFDSVAVHLVILGFKKNLEPKTLKNTIHFLIYHHYMILYHKISVEHELLQMRSKIANHIVIDLDSYLKEAS
jgi:hypothetical protein